MITILKRLNNSWDTISFETKFLNCDRVMKRLGQFSLVVVDRADGCSNKERIKLSILVELISKTYKLYKEMMSYRDFKKYAEVLFIIETARKKVLTRPEKIRKEEGTFQESQNNKKA